MKFYVINATGTTVHVRLDRDAKSELILTVSKKKVLKGRPLTEYVLATKTPVEIGYLGNGMTFTLRNPERMIIRVFEDKSLGAVMRIEGFLN